MDCAQKHVALANQQVDAAQHVFNDKIGILDRLSAAAKACIKAEHNKIIKQADTERDQAFAQIDQFLEQQKKQIRDKNTRLSQLPLDEIPSHIQRVTREMEYINEENKQLFSVTCTSPRIQVQHKH
jgi:hypothetical protein